MNRTEVAALLATWATSRRTSTAAARAEKALLALGLVPTYDRHGKPVAVTHPALLD